MPHWPFKTVQVSRRPPLEHAGVRPRRERIVLPGGETRAQQQKRKGER